MQGHREYTLTHPHTTEGAGLITHKKKKTDITIKHLNDSLKVFVCFPKKQPLVATCHCVIVVIWRTMFGVTPCSSTFVIHDKKNNHLLQVRDWLWLVKLQTCSSVMGEKPSLCPGTCFPPHAKLHLAQITPFFKAGDSLFHSNRFDGKLMCWTNLFSTEFTQKKKLGMIYNYYISRTLPFQC